MSQNLLSDTASVPLRGFYEVTLRASSIPARPFTENDLLITFTKSDGTQVTVPGFYDGEGVYKARAYVDVPGRWAWRSMSTMAGLGDKRGDFDVSPSHLPGKLRQSSRDPWQFAYDNGDWFLHLGDTGYRYLNSAEPKWQPYIDQAAAAGFTKIRTWFGTPGGGSNGNIAYMFTREGLNLTELQAADQRLIYALNQHPRMQMQVIPFGEDHEKLKAYVAGDAMARAYAREIHARFGALPNVQWTLSNDRNLDADADLRQAIDRLGADWAAGECWGTLLTNHQARFQTYAYVDAPWSDIVTFENLDQVAGERIGHYRDVPKVRCPIVNDEDRYECYRPPLHHRYFFRRMMWASLLSGGHATYGGGVTWQPYEPGTNKGVQGYADLNAAGLLQEGAADFQWIHRFFDVAPTLEGFVPDDALVGNDPARYKAARSDDALIVYLANPSGDKPETDDASVGVPTVTVGDSWANGRRHGYWFKPTTGKWTKLGQVAGNTFTAPSGGDWVLLLRR